MSPEHVPIISAGDLWAWLVREPDGSEGIVGADIQGVGPCQLVVGSRTIAIAMRPYAEQHAKVSGKPVRLVHFRGRETLVRLNG